MDKEKDDKDKALFSEPQLDFDFSGLSNPTNDKKEDIYFFEPFANANEIDFTKVKANKIMLQNQKGILERQKPSWIPDVPDSFFEYNRFIPPFYRDGENFVINFKERTKEDVFIKVTPEVLACTIDYHIKRAKERARLEAVKNNEKRINFFKKELDKTIPNTPLYEKYINIIEGKNSIKPKRVSIISSNKMTHAQMELLRNQGFDASSAWKEYQTMRSEISQKLTDLALHHKEFNSVYTKGQQTAYGDWEKKDSLLKDYGVFVKRQNGNVITHQETQEIKNVLDKMYLALGNVSELSREFGLKISHAAEKHMHARVAVGIFSPHYKAIGVSFMENYKFPELILAHEYGHFLDYVAGKKIDHHYASDKSGTIEADIAKTFRGSMVKKQISDYQNRTCECFARAIEQYSAYKLGVMEQFLDNNKQLGNYIEKNTFEKNIVPKINLFLEQRKELFKIKKVQLNIQYPKKQDTQRSRQLVVGFDR